MKELPQQLLDGLTKNLDGNMSLEEIEATLTSPIIVMEGKPGTRLPKSISNLVHQLDMWELNNLSREDIVRMRQQLHDYLATL